MKKNPWVLIALFFLIITQPSHIQAQKIEKKINLLWTNNLTRFISEEKSIEFLHFENAVYLQSYPTLPCYYEMIPIDNFYNSYNIHIVDAQYEAVSAQDCALIPSSFKSTQLDVTVRTARERNRTYALLTIIPFVKNGDGQFSRLKSLSIELEGKQPKNTKATQTHANQSVLATGNWYNLAVTETGIYKVTYADLTAIGLSTPISSSSIALFGNGGAMLPEPNSVKRPDDLQELPIQIFDGGDGTIDNNDYFLFFGHSPHSEYFDSTENKFCHSTNIYSDTTWYFITSTPGIGAKKRITAVDNSHLTATHTVNDYTFYSFVEDDIYNFSETGKDWFGDLFDLTTSRTYRFRTPGTPVATGKVSVFGANTASMNGTFKVDINNVTVGNVQMAGASTAYQAVFGKSTLPFSANSSNLDVTLTYSKPSNSASAYLNWLEIEIPCQLSMGSTPFEFRNLNTIGEGNITQFNLSGASSSTSIWDVTDPTQSVQYTLTSDGATRSFKARTDTLRTFYAFDSNHYKSITRGSSVPNQNLHATSNVDLVIVTHPKFLSQAKRLAEFRQSNDGLSVNVVTTQQVYNEFSSGSMDPMAIRDYMKLIYDKTNHQYPKYLLLFGRPSYDYRGRDNGTEIYVPNYQYATHDGVNENDFYSNDDTFGLLDDEEGEGFGGLYDLGVGRIPSSTVAQATTAVDKFIRYSTRRNLVDENSSAISNLGDWRNMMAFVADDEDYNDFISNADNFATIVERDNANINFDKIYLDAYQQVSNAGGQRYPEVTTAINNRMERGALVFTYVGHSGKDGWSAERVLENSDINKWKNKYNMPMMLTLSCTFGYYDRPALSPAELILFNSNGGAAGLITATREAWSTPNNTFGRYLFSYLFNNDLNRAPTLSELEIHAKNRYGGANSSLAMFVTMGDPSMKLAVPIYNIVTDSVNHVSVQEVTDTLRALSKVTISGHITDLNGNLLENFNGDIFPSVYDKKATVTTLANDPSSIPFNFETQKSVLFKGNCSVTNGKFNFSFYIPRDIDYNFGNGKISYYGRSSQLEADAAGAFSNFIIGGTDTSGLEDKEGPEIELFLNDENFVNGGITNPNPILIAKIKDNYGINTTGNGIGHNLTAVIDNATDNPIILNDYYQTEKDSFNMGTVRYNLEEFAPGKHTLLVRAWDINNNHSERELTFEVVSDEGLVLSHVLNYPNPFTTHTDFYFEQNQTGGIFDIQIQIFTISGKLVRTINTTQNIEGSRSAPITWDGRDDYGDKIGKGVYMYRLRVRNQNNEISEKIEKIVIL